MARAKRTAPRADSRDISAAFVEVPTQVAIGHHVSQQAGGKGTLAIKGVLLRDS
jgi:hypothetical protein